VQWFANEVMPQLLAVYPAIRFYIVGSRPSDAVRALGKQPNIVVTGTVPDVRPYLANARVVVAPLRIARGIQNKVLEALAMARPVVATTAALDGLDGVAESGAKAANDPDSFAKAIIELLRDDSSEQMRARAYVCKNFGWDASLQSLDPLFSAPHPSRGEVP
jgi:glycosyltransferase involved in cell wall biosynthesis